MSRHWIEVVILALPLLALLVLLPQLQENGWSLHSNRRSIMQQSQRLQRSSSNGDPRPIIYTFYDPSDHLDETLRRREEQLLEAWQELWDQQGWDPVVLDTSHAELHPSYKTHSRIFESKHYRRFKGWLAMASLGTGGWMSTTDCFPLGISALADGTGPLPNTGAFTTYEGTNPSLFSGSGFEWERMAKELIKLADAYDPEVREHQVYSDRKALRDLFLNQPMPFIQENSVGSYLYKRLGKVDCDAARHVFAVHLTAHETQFALNAGVLDIPQGKDIHDRHYFARVLNKRWRQQCLGEDITQTS